jgi:hypothetical protein
MEVVAPDRQTFAVIGAGDDSYALTLSRTVPDVTIYSKLGFTLIYEPVTNPCEASFLSARFVPLAVDGTPTYALMPQPGRILSRFGWIMIPPKPEQYLSYVRGNTIGLTDMFDFPFVGPFLQTHLRLTSYSNAVYPRLENQHHAPNTITSTHETWAWFSQRYHLYPSDEHIFKQALNLASSLPFEMPLDYVRRMVEIDVGSPPIVDTHDYRNENWSPEILRIHARI